MTLITGERMKSCLLPAILIAFSLISANGKAEAEQVSSYLKQACVEILKSSLRNPASLNVVAIDSNVGMGSDPGSIYIDYAAKNDSGDVIKERAYCQVPGRATVSMMTAHRREYSHLN